MKRTFIMAIILVGLVGLVSSCTKAEDEPEPSFDYSDISGVWYQYAYKCSDGYFVNIEGNGLDEYYSFGHTGEFEHYGIMADGQKDIHTTGKYTYNPQTHEIHVDEPRGWNLDINVVFDGENTAVFNIKGRTNNQSSTIRVRKIK